MNLFCLLFIPLVYFFRRSDSEGEGRNIWALLLGGVAALVQYFAGRLITPGAFGFSRWMSGFVDITGLPALVPFAVCCLLVMLRIFPSAINYAGFTLLWLVPSAAFYSMSSASSLIPLVLVPVLWAAQAVGISFFIERITRDSLNKARWHTLIPSVLGIAALPIAATTSWWAFFSQRNFLGVLLLAISLIPAALSFLAGNQITRGKLKIALTS